jgi:hypothetical protein
LNDLIRIHALSTFREGFGTQTGGFVTTAAAAGTVEGIGRLGKGPTVSCPGDKLKITYHAIKINTTTSGTKIYRQYRLRLYFGARFVVDISYVFLGKTS